MENLLLIENLLPHGVQLILSPWIGTIYEVDAGDTAALAYPLRPGAWAEVDCTESAVFVHLWADTPCDVTIYAEDAQKLHASLPAYGDETHSLKRPTRLNLWAQANAEASIRLALSSTSRVALAPRLEPGLSDSRAELMLLAAEPATPGSQARVRLGIGPDSFAVDLA